MYELKWVGAAKKFRGKHLIPISCGAWVDEGCQEPVLFIQGHICYRVKKGVRQGVDVKLYFRNDKGHGTSKNVHWLYRVFLNSLRIREEEHNESVKEVV